NPGAVEEEFAAGNDDARAARYGQRDCGEVYKIVDSRQLKVDSGRDRQTEMGLSAEILRYAQDDNRGVGLGVRCRAIRVTRHVAMQVATIVKKSSRSAPLRGRGTPANLARLRSERARNS